MKNLILRLVLVTCLTGFSAAYAGSPVLPSKPGTVRRVNTKMTMKTANELQSKYYPALKALAGYQSSFISLTWPNDPGNPFKGKSVPFLMVNMYSAEAVKSARAIIGDSLDRLYVKYLVVDMPVAY